MKLAEALNTRKDKIALLSTFEGMAREQAFSEDSKSDELMKKMTSLNEEICEMDAAINSANMTIEVEVDKESLTLLNARYRRDRYMDLSRHFEALVNARPSYRSEDSVLRMDKDKAFQLKQEFAKKARELDSAIQTANWTTEI